MMVNEKTGNVVVGNSREEVEAQVPAGERGATFELDQTFMLKGMEVKVVHLSQQRVVLETQEPPKPGRFEKDDLVLIQNYYFRVLGMESATRVALVAHGKSKKMAYPRGDGTFATAKVHTASAKKRIARIRKRRGDF